jgi:protein-S-isoprenylcysteine O-methyltransferase Ste14
MTSQSILVTIIVLVVSSSGLLVNMARVGQGKMGTGKQDGGTLKAFRLAVLGSLIASCGFYFSNIGNFAPSLILTYLGCALALVGFALRWTAILSLGSAFTVKVTIIEGHQLKTDSIYKTIRHPSYTGLLLYYIGLALVMQNWISAIVLVLFPLLAVLNRIKLEEKVLAAYFKEEYSLYQSKSWRLLPYVF